MEKMKTNAKKMKMKTAEFIYLFFRENLIGSIQAWDDVTVLECTEK